MSRNLERVSSSSTSSSGGRRGPARPCGRVTTRTVIGPCGRAGATSARAGCFFVFARLDFSRACRCCLLCTCDLIYIRVHRSVCAPRHACCVLLRPATDDSGPFAQCAVVAARSRLWRTLRWVDGASEQAPPPSSVGGEQIRVCWISTRSCN